mmetsp:Transcript_31627/g.87292  ORF Transcript_31627/g.87292 Transcript_31627/m.87292 type:complete len:202 (+) Transcript_31627:578-1183(+)
MFFPRLSRSMTRFFSSRRCASKCLRSLFRRLATDLAFKSLPHTGHVQGGWPCSKSAAVSIRCGNSGRWAAPCSGHIAHASVAVFAYMLTVSTESHSSSNIARNASTQALTLTPVGGILLSKSQNTTATPAYDDVKANFSALQGTRCVDTVEDFPRVTGAIRAKPNAWQSPAAAVPPPTLLWPRMTCPPAVRGESVVAATDW